jgi:hypothetical protein
VFVQTFDAPSFAGADPGDVTTGSEIEPGVCQLDDGRWVAWATGRGEGDYFQVDQHDLDLGPTAGTLVLA